MELHPETMEVHYRAVKATPRATEAHFEDVEAHPGAVEAPHEAVHPEQNYQYKKFKKKFFLVTKAETIIFYAFRGGNMMGVM